MNDNTIFWWYASGNQKYGPYSEAQIRELAQAGDVHATDWVWHHGLENWVQASSIEGLIPPAPLAPPELPLATEAAQPAALGPAVDRGEHSGPGGAVGGLQRDA